jgi:outer membrane receptor for ferric coprogen and ferric-rhodotorulic acid
VAAGTRVGFAASARAPLSSGSAFRQSLSLATERRDLDGPRASTAHTRLLYRAAARLAGGTLAMDAGASLGRDHPPSPRLHDPEAGVPLTPVDANFNPGGAQLSSDRYQLRLAYEHLAARGSWSAIASVARTQVTDLRGFLHPDDSGLVDVQDQARRLTDAYLDVHYTWIAGPRLHVVAGFDALYGTARQLTRNANDAYVAELDGSGSLPQAAGLATNEAIRLHDVRRFLGQYLQLEVRPAPHWTALLGLRLNEVSEDKDGSVLDLASGDSEADATRQSTVRGTFSAGLTHALHDGDGTRLAAFADYRTAFKPAALDFGPDYTPELLAPETSRTQELGLRGALGIAAGEPAIRYELALFRSQFANLVVPTVTGSLANAASQRLQGVEAELGATFARDWSLTASGAYHESKYQDYATFENGQAAQLAGRLLPLAPRFLGAATLEYGSTARRWSGGLTLHYAGHRYLEPTNEFAAGGYATLDARLGLALGRTLVTLEGSNLGDRRPPIVASEFGASSYYLLPGRRVWLRASWAGGSTVTSGN